MIWVLVCLGSQTKCRVGKQRGQEQVHDSQKCLERVGASPLDLNSLLGSYNKA